MDVTAIDGKNSQKHWWSCCLTKKRHYMTYKKSFRYTTLPKNIPNTL